jgi:natural product precursor
MRTLKKLKLKKEVIERLEDNQMKRLMGGGNFCPYGNRWTYCADGTCSGGTYTSCS